MPANGIQATFRGCRERRRSAKVASHFPVPSEVGRSSLRSPIRGGYVQPPGTFRLGAARTERLGRDPLGAQNRSLDCTIRKLRRKKVCIDRPSIGWTNQVRIPFSIEELSCVSYDAGFQNGPAKIEAVPLRINDSAGNGYGLQPSAPSVKRSK